MRHIALAALTTLAASAAAQEAWMPYDPDVVHARAGANIVEIGNKALSLSFGGQHVSLKSWRSKKQPLKGTLFDLMFMDGERPSGPPPLVSGPTVSRVTPQNSLRLASHLSGQAVKMSVTDRSTGASVQTRVVMLDHTNYVRLEITISAKSKDVDLSSINFYGLNLPGAQVVGTVPGSPISNGQFFLGLEHPMSKSEVKNGLATCSIQRKLPLRKGQSVTYSAVIGAEAPGQARRSFASYVNLERARPYSPFLHYNSWYDLGYFNRYNEPETLDRINAFGNELVKKRGVKLSSFLFDDGWDDTSTNWQFHNGFPHGFTPLKTAAAKYGAAPGVWLSPWGGYGKPREERLATGKKNGYEIDSQGFALSGPKYYDLFSKVCLKMVTDYGINQFKLDGTGSPDKQYPGSKFDSDFDAAIQLISTLRKANPGLFVNLTTGTWPSPFWTRYADSTWRGGSDHDFAGVGPDRQRWITYRDSDTYHEVVMRGPFYPLNSLMLHGLIYAQYADKLKTDPTNAFRDEIRSYFGNGTQLQEVYITPSLLTKQNWDDLAQSANWSQANKEVLKDSHWIGGDPEKLEVYGWASWSPGKSIIALRNPSDHEQAFAIEPRQMLEIPPDKNGALQFKSVFGDSAQEPFETKLDEPFVAKLQPFEVVVFEGVAQ
jgi:hypothetical protein